MAEPFRGSDATARPERRRKRRALFVVLGLVLVTATLELGGTIAWWAATGEVFTFGRAAAARERARTHGGDAAAAGEARRQAVQRAAAHGVMVHPFLGYVHDGAGDPDEPFPVSRFGFVDDRPPLRRRAADRFIVGVVGGSVALHFGLYAEDRFVAALRRSPALAGREIEVVNLALGGYKQPQQLLAVQLVHVLGGQFDCIVNLDGFNEVALVQENVPLGVPGWFPRSWARLLDTVPTAEQQRRIGHIVVLGEERRARADSADLLWWSPLAQFVWRWRDRDLVERLARLRSEAERAAAAPSPAVTGPGTAGQSLAESRVEMVSVWRRASKQLHDLCAASGALYLHFLQPNQYVPGSKPIGPEEAGKAIELDHPWRAAVLDGYPMLQREGAGLRAEGVAFTDLTMIFADHEEPLYTDTCCHFGQRGHAIVAEHVAAAIRRRLDLDGVEWRRLIVEPQRVELATPFAGERLRVVGVDSSGREHDISGVGFGTRVTASPAGTVVVGADGSVRASRRGDAVLLVAQGDTSTEVAVSANWPDVFEAADGRAPPGGEVPRLLVDERAVAAGAEALAVTCTGLPPAPFRFVAVSPDPLPESPSGAEHFGLKLVPLPAEGDTAKADVPVAAPAGQPMFVRFYALAANAADVVAASNTIVITRG